MKKGCTKEERVEKQKNRKWTGCKRRAKYLNLKKEKTKLQQKFKRQNKNGVRAVDVLFSDFRPQNLLEPHPPQGMSAQPAGPWPRSSSIGLNKTYRFLIRRERIWRIMVARFHFALDSIMCILRTFTLFFNGLSKHKGQKYWKIKTIKKKHLFDWPARRSPVREIIWKPKRI